MTGNALWSLLARPRRGARIRFSLALVAAALVMLVAYGEVAFGGRTFTTGLSEIPGVNGGYLPPDWPGRTQDKIRVDRGASAWQIEPWAHVTDAQIKSGQLPLWNPYQAMGTPLLANMQSAPFDPILLPVRISPTPLAWDVSYLLAFALGGIFTFLYCRCLRLRNVAAFVGAAAFVLSGWFILYSNEEFVHAYMYLPAVLLLVDLVIERPTPLRVGGLALAITGNLFAGFPEASILVLGTGAAYALMRVAIRRRPMDLLYVGAGGVLGFALAAPQLIPFLQYLSLGHTIHESGYQQGLGFDQDATRVLSWIVPFLRGNTFSDYVTGGFTGVRSWSGCAVAGLCLVALSAKRRRPTDPTWFMAAASAFVILKLYGFPGVQFVGRLPGLSAVQFVSFAPPLASFAMAVLAAVGIDALAEGTVNIRRFWVLAAVAAAGLVTLFLLNDPHALVAAAPHLRVLLALLVAAAAALGVCSAVMFQGRRHVHTALAVAVVVELGLICPRGFYQERFDVLLSPAWATALPAVTTDRVYGLDAQLYPDTAAAISREDIRSLDALFVSRYFNYIKYFIQPNVDSRFMGSRYEEVTGGHIAGNPMFDLLGVRYVVSEISQPDDEALPRLLTAASPATASAAVSAGGEVRLARAERGGHEIAFPFAERTPNMFSFSVAATGAASTPLTVAIDGVTASSRSELWRRTLVVPATAWLPFAVDVPAGTTAVILRVEGTTANPAPTVAWADVRLGPDQYRHVAGFGPEQIYENDRRFARAFVVHTVRAVGDQGEARDYIGAHSQRLPDGALHVVSFDPSQEAVVEAQRAPVVSSCATRDEARIVQYDAEQVVIETDAGCAGFLVLTDTYFPGWTARVNGQSVPISPTDIAFRGVVIPAGHARAVFTYEPSQLRAGELTAGLGVLGFAVGSIAWWRRERADWPF